MIAERMLDDARARAKAARKTVGVVSHQSPRGEVVVAWDVVNQEYEVGTAARAHATGRRSVVLPVLERLLAPEPLPQDMYSGLGDGS